MMNFRTGGLLMMIALFNLNTILFNILNFFLYFINVMRLREGPSADDEAPITDPLYLLINYLCVLFSQEITFLSSKMS